MFASIQSNKKRIPSGRKLFLKVKQKPENLDLKLCFDMQNNKTNKEMPLHHRADSYRNIKSPYATPQIKAYKLSQKQNGHKTALNSYNTSCISTPFVVQLSIEERHECRNDYRFMYYVGSGGFGRVWKVQEKKTNQVLAMKQISKAKVLLKKSVSSIINQRVILQHCRSRFIINMKSAFQDRQFLYMTMEYLRGADLRYHLCFKDYFTQQQTKFIACCIIQGLQYIHSKKIIHRDLKPENLVFEENGYVRITDFGVARKNKDNNSDQTSGTPGYMAPQVICRMNHSYEADFFALGVIVYQLMLGTRPYLGETRKQIRDKILAHQAKISQRDLPRGWSVLAVDFINKLIRRHRESRLGFKGIEEVKKHPWLIGINWRKLSRKQLTPPFIPGVMSQSAQYQREMDTHNTEPNEDTQMLLRTIEMQQIFKDYDYSRNIKQF